MFGFNDKIAPEPAGEGVTRKILTYNDDLMMVEVSFESGAIGSAHSHPHLQQTYVAKGSFEFTIGDETQVVKLGDSILIPRDAVHGVKALEEGILVDIFTPKRDDFL